MGDELLRSILQGVGIEERDRLRDLHSRQWSTRGQNYRNRTASLRAMGHHTSHGVSHVFSFLLGKNATSLLPLGEGSRWRLELLGDGGHAAADGDAGHAGRDAH